MMMSTVMENFQHLTQECPECTGSPVGGASRTTPGPFRGDQRDPAGDFVGPTLPTRGQRQRFRASVPPGRFRPCGHHGQ